MASFHPSCVDRQDIETTLRSAEQLCVARGSRLTALRRRVLEIILRSDRPQGAYAILDELRAEGRSGAPPTVYRALDFLLEQRLIHRLASLNVFIGCPHPEHRHNGQFLICRRCGRVAELASSEVDRSIRDSASEQGFKVEAQMVEILGHCADCQPPGPNHVD